MPPQDGATADFVVVANRLPVDSVTHPDGSHEWVPSPGGLVAALSPVLAQHHGCWVGWPGTTDDSLSLEPFRTDSGILLHPVSLSAADYAEFYEGFSNATLWPLYHDLIVQPIYQRSWWSAYRQVNLRFAEEVAKVASPHATVWVQDYQLQLLPGILRQLRPDLRIGFFLHIPFPAADLFRQLPWREEIVRGLLGADVIGFHLPSYANNFLTLSRQISGAAGSHTGQPDELTVYGKAQIRKPDAAIVAPDGRRVQVAAFPISIDLSSLGHPTAEDISAIRRKLGNPDTIMLGVDRLDYTKGILQRLQAFEQLLEHETLDPDQTVLVQIATPSRERIKQYQQERARVEEAVGRINGRFGKLGQPVVHYLHRSLPKAELAACYAAADIMLVTAFKDGMNLVAKEFAAMHPDGSGALVLSEFAGAAEELSHAHLCNPHDLESVKRAIFNAVYSLSHQPEDAGRRMQALYQQVHTHDVNLWANSFLSFLTDHSQGGMS
ncbi:trehalose-6-phosphate synthase [Corynebacterium poyangense]|uniref:alpha,alpha-trehalose-phosphate synthase (ADP-forming) n=1 Tax=Corynebacterium poyangense TaxID=2684405 RepID=A0A7H0SR23_9CORY|nr:trehalose-6-phosphate synthase [Corynebacterium poyangense]MBZ8176420.1 trehalose-6-phosphate synthase [Corynebacterium poyangense]QNQ90998.1 trehalose-6-phosphate synthase [Corynebacterium poyangense]